MRRRGKESSEASGDDGRARALCRKHSVEWANGGMGVVKAEKVGRGGGKGARRGRRVRGAWWWLRVICIIGVGGWAIGESKGLEDIA